MYTLLIADDEKWMKQRLAETIDWKQLQIKQIYTASNGIEALALIIKHEPDIVLSDIKMPGYTGIQLMQEAYVKKLKCKFVLISGFAEFQLAQDALRYGAIDYLLKPVKDLSVIEAVEKCIALMIEEKKQTQYLSNYLDHITEKIYKNLILGHYHDEKELAEECHSFQINFSLMHCGCMVIKYTKGFQLNPENIIALTAIIQKELANLTLTFPETQAFFLCNFDQHFVCIFQTNLSKLQIAEITENLSKSIELSSASFSKYGFATGCGRFYTSILDLAKSYTEALTALRYHIYTANSHFHNIDDLITSEYEFKTCYPDNLDIVAMHIKNGEPQSALTLIKNYIQSILPSFTPADIQLIAINYSNELIRQLLNLGFSPNQLSLIPILLLEHLQSIYSPHDAYDMLECMVNSILLEENSASTLDFTLQNIILYIKKNYHLPISSKSVAEEFHYNPSYFSKLFSDEVGQPFTKFLGELRVQKAKELLKRPHMRISEVAKEVGFDDYQCFVRTFKQYAGFSPSAYRDSLI